VGIELLILNVNLAVAPKQVRRPFPHNIRLTVEFAMRRHPKKQQRRPHLFEGVVEMLSKLRIQEPNAYEFVVDFKKARGELGDPIRTV
jgi:hypothetical protein